MIKNAKILSSNKMLDIIHTYFNILKHQILEIETGEVEVVKHSMELKEEYQSILNTIFGGE